jgi:DNA-binding YbaB/EbfC family protein
LKDLSEVMRQAQEMQRKLAEAQARMETLTAEGSAGGGLVMVRLKGKGELDAVRFDPSLLKPDEAEIVEDLVKAAHADARRKLDEKIEDEMRKATGGLGGMLPGFKMPF